MYYNPVGRTFLNSIDFANNKVDEYTLYSLKKQVEDSCRAMISSYTSDVLIWEQYKDSADEFGMNLAAQAKIRANKTAATYNNYILTNSYVWAHNVPFDIATKLPYVGL